jgi:hypothetical protein
MGTEPILIDAAAEDQDDVLLDRVAPWAREGPVSFLRVNKPVWRLEVIRHGAGTLAQDAADAVADSALALDLLALERDGRLPRPRRELLLRAMRRVADGLALTREQRLTVHRAGYAWPIELGRWDDAGIAALETRFLSQRDGIDALLASPCDPRSEERWQLLARGTGEPGSGVDRARRTIGHHANRLGVFAEVEAILHYFLFRLDADREHA